MIIEWVLIAIAALGLLLAGSSVRVITQFEREVVLRFGQLRDATRGPGLTLITPIADRLHKVNMQIVTMPVPPKKASGVVARPDGAEDKPRSRAATPPPAGAAAPGKSDLIVTG